MHEEAVAYHILKLLLLRPILFLELIYRGDLLIEDVLNQLIVPLGTTPHHGPLQNRGE